MFKGTPGTYVIAQASKVVLCDSKLIVLFMECGFLPNTGIIAQTLSLIATVARIVFRWRAVEYAVSYSRLEVSVDLLFLSKSLSFYSKKYC